jgi:hypothetical protein
MRLLLRFFAIDRSALRCRSVSDLTSKIGDGNRNRVGLESLAVHVSSKIICKKNAVSVQERWGAGQLETSQEKAAFIGMYLDGDSIKVLAGLITTGERPYDLDHRRAGWLVLSWLRLGGCIWHRSTGMASRG